MEERLRRRLKDSTAMPERHAHIEICISMQFCTQQGNTSTQMNQKLKQLGLGELKLHCTCKHRDQKEA